MERIDGALFGHHGTFYIPLADLSVKTRIVDDAGGSEQHYLVFDELTALELASHLEEGAHALLNPVKRMPRRVVPAPSGGLKKSACQTTAELEARVLELETMMLEFHRSFGAEERARTVQGLRQELDALRAQVRELDTRTLGMMRFGPNP